MLILYQYFFKQISGVLCCNITQMEVTEFSVTAESRLTNGGKNSKTWKYFFSLLEVV